MNEDTITPDVMIENAWEDDDLTFAERLADQVAAFGGSWCFMFLFFAILAGWIILNAYRYLSIDPPPYQRLNLCLSCLAAVQGPIIMMSQNRQASKDRYHLKMDYELNRKAEAEVRDLKLMAITILEQQEEILANQRKGLCRNQTLGTE